MAKYYQGKFKPKNPEKYKGKVEDIYYRSSWELKAFKWCDETASVLKWASEEIVIPYMSPIDNKKHRYFVDLYFEVKDSSGTVKKYLAEIKPEKQTAPPDVSKKKNKRYIQEAMTYAVNEAKWNAAKEACKDSGVEFIILTEKHLGIR